MPSSQHASSSTHPLGAGMCVHLTSPVASPRAYRRSGTLSLHSSPALRPAAALASDAPVDDDPLLRSLQNGDISLDAVLAFPVHWHRLAASLSGSSSAPSSARSSASAPPPVTSPPETPLRSTSLPGVPTERPTRPSRRAARFAALAHAAGSEASLDLQSLRRPSALERALNSARQYVPPPPGVVPGMRRRSSAPDAATLAAAAAAATTPRAAGCSSADWDLISPSDDASTPVPRAPGSPRIPMLSLAPMSPSETTDEAGLAASVPRSPQPLLPGALGLSFLTPAPSAPSLPIASEAGAAGISSEMSDGSIDDFGVAPDECLPSPSRPPAPAAQPVYDFAAAAAAATLAVEARCMALRGELSTPAKPARAPGWVAGWNGFGAAPRAGNSIA